MLPVVAHAEVRSPATAMIIASSPTDFARITNTNPPRLRRTQEEQPGNEMAHVAFFTDASGNIPVPTAANPNQFSGFMFAMTTDLVDPSCIASASDPTTCSHRANDRVQLSLVPIQLVKDSTGAVTVQPVYTGLGTNTDQTGGARFVTNNRGHGYRNANNPVAFSVLNGAAICAEYNYQPNNNTDRYMECFNQQGATIMPQTRIYAKTNDNCSMNQDKNSTWVASVSGSVTHLVGWRGCNGNGRDDGWAQVFNLTADSATAPTRMTFKQVADVSLCKEEERSHGYCTTGTDSNTAICSWTEGNTQPQRKGVWLAAIDISGNTQGSNMIYWKQQIDGRHTLSDGHRAYAMRAMTDRIMSVNSSGALVPTDDVIWRSALVRGHNSTNTVKGGKYFANNIAVIKATKDGMSYVVPMTDMSSKLLGLDGTHLGMTFGLFGTTDKLVPGLAFIMGSHTAGAYGATIQFVGVDAANSTFTNLGQQTGAPYDRHLYSNYLGENPGNQGRDYMGSEFIKNPYATGAAGEDAYLMVMATTGKPAGEVAGAPGCIDCAKRKLASFLTVLPVAQTPAASNPSGSGSGSGSGTGSGNGSGVDTPPSNPGTTLGGCSTSGGAGGAATFLLIGLAAFIRRRK